MAPVFAMTRCLVFFLLAVRSPVWSLELDRNARGREQRRALSLSNPLLFVPSNFSPGSLRSRDRRVKPSRWTGDRSSVSPFRLGGGLETATDAVSGGGEKGNVGVADPETKKDEKSYFKSASLERVIKALKEKKLRAWDESPPPTEDIPPRFSIKEVEEKIDYYPIFEKDLPAAISAFEMKTQPPFVTAKRVADTVRRARKYVNLKIQQAAREENWKACMKFFDYLYQSPTPETLASFEQEGIFGFSPPFRSYSREGPIQIDGPLWPDAASYRLILTALMKARQIDQRLMWTIFLDSRENMMWTGRWQWRAAWMEKWGLTEDQSEVRRAMKTREKWKRAVKSTRLLNAGGDSFLADTAYSYGNEGLAMTYDANERTFSTVMSNILDGKMDNQQSYDRAMVTTSDNDWPYPEDLADVTNKTYLSGLGLNQTIERGHPLAGIALAARQDADGFAELPSALLRRGYADGPITHIIPAPPVIPKDAHIYAIITALAGRKGDYWTAVKVKSMMEEDGIVPNVELLTSFIRACDPTPRRLKPLPIPVLGDTSPVESSNKYFSRSLSSRGGGDEDGDDYEDDERETEERMNDPSTTAHYLDFMREILFDDQKRSIEEMEEKRKKELMKLSDDTYSKEGRKGGIDAELAQRLRSEQLNSGDAIAVHRRYLRHAGARQEIDKAYQLPTDPAALDFSGKGVNLASDGAAPAQLTYKSGMSPSVLNETFEEEVAKRMMGVQSVTYFGPAVTRLGIRNHRAVLPSLLQQPNNKTKGEGEDDEHVALPASVRRVAGNDTKSDLLSPPWDLLNGAEDDLVDGMKKEDKGEHSESTEKKETEKKNDMLKGADTLVADFQLPKEGERAPGEDGVFPAPVSLASPLEAMHSAYFQRGPHAMMSEEFTRLAPTGPTRPKPTIGDGYDPTEGPHPVRLDEALQAFRAIQQISVPDISVYNALLNTLAKAGKWQLAISVLDELEGNSVEVPITAEGPTWNHCPLGPNIVSYSCVILACTRSGAWKEALEVWVRLKKRQALVDRLPDVGQPKLISPPPPIDLRDEFNLTGIVELPPPPIPEDMPEPRYDPEKTFNQDDLLKALESFCPGMAQRERWGDIRRLVTKRYMKLRLQPDTRVYAMIIHAFQELHKPAEALKVLSKMKREGTPIDLVTYSSTVAACARVGFVPGVFRLLEEMEREGIQPSYICFCAALHGTAMAGNWRAALTLLAEVKRRRMPEACYPWISTILACAREKKVDLALTLLMEDMPSWGIVPDRQSIRAALMVCGMAGAVDAAFRVFDYSRKLGFAPDSLTFLYMLEACENGGDYETGERLWFFFIDHLAVPPNGGCYNSFIRTMSKADRVQDAAAVIRDLEAQNADDVLLPATFRCLISALLRKRDTVQALEMFERHRRVSKGGEKDVYEPVIFFLARTGRAVPRMFTYETHMMGFQYGIYTRDRSNDNALDLLEDMLTLQMLPSIEVWKEIAFGMQKEGHHKAALMLLTKLRQSVTTEEDIESAEILFKTALTRWATSLALSRSPSAEAAKSVLEEFLRSSDSTLEESNSSSASLARELFGSFQSDLSPEEQFARVISDPGRSEAESVYSLVKSFRNPAPVTEAPAEMSEGASYWGSSVNADTVAMRLQLLRQGPASAPGVPLGRDQMKATSIYYDRDEPSQVLAPLAPPLRPPPSMALSSGSPDEASVASLQLSFPSDQLVVQATHEAFVEPSVSPDGSEFIPMKDLVENQDTSGEVTFLKRGLETGRWPGYNGGPGQQWAGSAFDPYNDPNFAYGEGQYAAFGEDPYAQGGAVGYGGDAGAHPPPPEGFAPPPDQSFPASPRTGGSSRTITPLQQQLAAEAKAMSDSTEFDSFFSEVGGGAPPPPGPFPTKSVVAAAKLRRQREQERGGETGGGQDEGGDWDAGEEAMEDDEYS